MEPVITGFLEIFNIQTVLWIALGEILGIILGSLPGLTATMGIALMLPVSFQLSDATGMALLLGVYCGAVSGASIPAILLGIFSVFYWHTTVFRSGNRENFILFPNLHAISEYKLPMAKSCLSVVA